MLRHLDCGRGRQLNHLAPTDHADPPQGACAHRTIPDAMLDDLRWGFTLACVIVRGITLLPLLLGFGLRLLHIGFDKRCWRRLLLLQLLDALVSRRQLLQVLALPLLGLA